MQQWNEDDFFNRLIFDDESTFQLSGRVNEQNVRIWGTKTQGNCCSRCGIRQKLTFFVLYPVQRCKGHFSPENIVTRITYLDIFSEWLLPQMQQDAGNFIFIQDGAPPHWHSWVQHYLDKNLPRRSIWRSTDENMALTCWPPRSTDLTPCDFFLWRSMKTRVFRSYTSVKFKRTETTHHNSCCKCWQG